MSDNQLPTISEFLERIRDYLRYLRGGRRGRKGGGEEGRKYFNNKYQVYTYLTQLM